MSTRSRWSRTRLSLVRAQDRVMAVVEYRLERIGVDEAVALDRARTARLEQRPTLVETIARRPGSRLCNAWPSRRSARPKP
jgi:hypothetical protein